MTWFHPHFVRRRAEAGGLFVGLMFGVLASWFFYIQVIGRDHYVLQSNDNRLRVAPIPAPRGLILDRNGVVLADNVPGYSIAIFPPDPEALPAILRRLDHVPGLDSARIETIVRRFHRFPHEPAVILRDAPFDLVSALEESRATIPILDVQAEPKRRYPRGAVVAHALGYVGEITEEEMLSGKIRGARGGLVIGRDGLERQYDEQLRGTDGRKTYEVTALGHIVEVYEREQEDEPEQGDTLRTTLDIELQAFVDSVFPPGFSGGVVAMDPRNGDLLALYSAPSYDPNLFVGGMDPEAWRALSQAEDQPLFNRAIEGRYAPASPFKLAVAAMALKRDSVTVDSHMEIPCTGGLWYGNRYFKCWREDGHGNLSLMEAIQYSCDVYFYQLGLKLSLPNLLADGAEMGFLDRSGIDLPDESAPVFPAGTEYYDTRYGPRGWTSGVTLNMAIGQGENAQSLINMVSFYAKLANPDGAAPPPHLKAQGDFERRSLGLSEEQVAQLREALTLVVEGGTATGARVAGVSIAGKTGTAQNPQGAPHGWFIGFAPRENPEIVVGAIIEHAEHGSSVAPLVTRTIQKHLLGEAPSYPLRLVLPEDSAPEPLPIVPDTGAVSSNR
ncbi:MAG: penicillin-binding protein 2 [Gemmatimonadales bacterium]|jgi:penicillin-binding protein 2